MSPSKTENAAARPVPDVEAALLGGLNPEQQRAVRHDDGPLLIVAGAGTGKTTTLAHRVAWLIAHGVRPQRILLLTFTRRAAAEMLRRVEAIALAAGSRERIPSRPEWRCGRRSGAAPSTRPPLGCCACTDGRSGSIRRSPSSTAATLRTSWACCAPNSASPRTTAASPRRAPAWTSTAGASTPQQRLNSSSHGLSLVQGRGRGPQAALRRVRATARPTRASSTTTTCCSSGTACSPTPAAAAVRSRFDCVLVDEYQDTNVLQAEILTGSAPTGGA